MFQVNFNRDLQVRVVIRQNDKVAYAFLLQNQKFIGYVWLYNLDEPAREKVERYQGELAVNFVDDVGPNPIVARSQDDFEVRWWTTANREIAASIYVCGKLVGRPKLGCLGRL